MVRRSGRWLVGTVLAAALLALPGPLGTGPRPAAAFSLGDRPLDNPYTIFVVSALIVAGWLAVFALLTVGREDQ